MAVTLKGTRDWEAQLRTWSTPPGVVEQQKVLQAEREVRAAIQASNALRARQVQVFAQGSYRNRTNVPRESDVDVCVRCDDTFYWDVLPADDNVRKMVAAEIVPATYRYADYKNDVERALTAYFGAPSVRRGDKAFTVRESTRRVDADVVAAFEHRRYSGIDAFPRGTYHQGTEFLSDSGGRIINWPQQHYENGVSKNARTHERFKALARIVKNLSNEMDDARVPAAHPMKSFLLESLVFNVPDNEFGHANFTDDLREVLRFLFLATRDDASCSQWGEVNEMKYLLHSAQPWTRAAANEFLLSAWRYVGFTN